MSAAGPASCIVQEDKAMCICQQLCLHAHLMIPRSLFTRPSPVLPPVLRQSFPLSMASPQATSTFSSAMALCPQPCSSLPNKNPFLDISPFLKKGPSITLCPAHLKKLSTHFCTFLELLKWSFSRLKSTGVAVTEAHRDLQWPHYPGTLFALH